MEQGEEVSEKVGRYSYKLKGQRVRHKQLVDSEGYYWYGTITHYDRLHGIVYVLWDATADCRFAISAAFPLSYLVKLKGQVTWQKDPKRR